MADLDRFMKYVLPVAGIGMLMYYTVFAEKLKKGVVPAPKPSPPEQPPQVPPPEHPPETPPSENLGYIDVSVSLLSPGDIEIMVSGINVKYHDRTRFNNTTSARHKFAVPTGSYWVYVRCYRNGVLKWQKESAVTVGEGKTSSLIFKEAYTQEKKIVWNYRVHLGGREPQVKEDKIPFSLDFDATSIYYYMPCGTDYSLFKDVRCRLYIDDELILDSTRDKHMGVKKVRIPAGKHILTIVSELLGSSRLSRSRWLYYKLVARR